MLKQRFILAAGLLSMLSAAVFADYAKGATMFQIYGGGAALGGHYSRSGVSREDRRYADGGGIIGGQFLYFLSENPCWALGADVSHANFDSHDTTNFISERFTQSSARATTGLFLGRLSYPRGHVRPYVQGGLGAHYTSLKLEATPFFGAPWSDTGTTEERRLYDEGHIGPAIGGAVGVYVYFTEKFFIGAEYKNTLLFGSDFRPTTAGRHEGLRETDGGVSESSIGFTLGLGF